MHPRLEDFWKGVRSTAALVCCVLLLPYQTWAFILSPQQQQQKQPQASSSQTKIPSDQLDSLVAPIALYPDNMLAQVLAASTYPLEIIQLHQWLQKNSGLKDKALADAVAKQPWDPSIQAMAGLPDVVKRLADDIQWTTDLGNAFLAQQSDVMAAVQRMRKKAQDNGNLKSNEQQKVQTTVVESSPVIVIEQANPQVVYVPSYNPTVVYGPPVYPYPPIYYPPPGYYAAGMAISFGVGVAMGAFWSGGWGWGCGWGGGDVYINNNNNFNRNTNINRGGNRNQVNPLGGRGNVGGAGGVGGVGGAGGVGGVGGVGGAGGVGGVGGAGGVGGVGGPGGAGGVGGGRNQVNPLGGGAGGGNTWSHNPQHRGGAPYRDRATADRFGGTARGESVANRQASARNQISRQGGNLSSNRASDRAGAGAGTGRGGGVGQGGSRAGGANQIGGRDISRNATGGGSAFGRGNYNGASARSSSSRGSSSFSGGGSRGGGGGRRGGGGGRRGR